MAHEITERIRQIMDEYGYSSSVFADEIGVQRPAISHILSGRNRPSLDVVMKILKAFDDINPQWLLTGEGSMKQLDLFGGSEELKEPENTGNKQVKEDNEGESRKTQEPLPSPATEHSESTHKNDPTEDFKPGTGTERPQYNEPSNDSSIQSHPPASNPADSGYASRYQDQQMQIPPHFQEKYYTPPQKMESRQQFTSDVPPGYQNTPGHTERSDYSMGNTYENYSKSTSQHPTHEPGYGKYYNPGKQIHNQPVQKTGEQKESLPPEALAAAFSAESGKKLEKIILIYSDKTFGVYTPE